MSGDSAHPVAVAAKGVTEALRDALCMFHRLSSTNYQSPVSSPTDTGTSVANPEHEKQLRHRQKLPSGDQAVCRALANGHMGSCSDNALHAAQRDYFICTMLNPRSEYAAVSDDVVWVVRWTALVPAAPNRTTAEPSLLRRLTSKSDDAEPLAVVRRQQCESEAEVARALSAMRASVVRKPSNGAGVTSESIVVEHAELINDPDVNWFATIGLNVACQWTYTLTVAVVRVVRLREFGRRPQMAVVRQVVKRVFADPYKSEFREKGQSAGTDNAGCRTDFPVVHFNIDDFETEFSNIKLAPGYHLAVLLVPGESQDSQAAVFRGIVGYDDVMKVMQRKFRHPKPGAPPAPVFIPLQASSGRSEIAVTVAEHDLRPSPQNEAPSGGALGALKSISMKVVRAMQPAPDETALPCALDGEEVLECQLTHLSVHVGHLLTVLLSRGGVTGQAAHADSETEGREAARPWCIFPADPAELDRWLAEDDSGRVAPGVVS